MKTLRILTACFGMILAGVSSVIAQNDKALEGTWITVSAQMQGKEVPATEIKDNEVIFGDGKMTGTVAGETVNVFTYKTGATQKPRHIDFEGIQGVEKGRKQVAIYEINNEVLLLCVSLERGDRPPSFRTEEGKDWVLLTLKRKKK